MRIGFFTSIEGWGGSETFLRDLMLGIRAAGHDVVLIGVEGSRLVGEMRAKGVECVVWRQGSSPGTSVPKSPSGRSRNRLWLSAPVGLKLTVGNLLESWRLARLLKAARLDLLHVNVHGYEIAGLAGWLVGLPLIGCYLIVPPPEPSFVRRAFREVTRWTYGHVVFQSAVGRDSVMGKSGRSTFACSIIPNGIEISSRVAHPFMRHTAAKGCRLLSMARLHAMKGHGDVIRAIALLKDIPVTLDILGEGPEEEALHALIRGLGLETRVRLLGHVDDFEEHLCSADGFIMASVSHESCPASLLLAMAATLPVITSDLPALTEINQAGVTGYVARMGDPMSVADCVLQLVNDPAASVKLGRAGRERVEQLFSKKRMVGQWIAVYKSVLSRSASGGKKQ